ncbi:hypothetical protein [Streptomyces sp. V1I1]|uniref:hypothetical protein n=1 Tax=Streptomyces sp. V1I1 TaxID=3042272 RepID=UPI002785F1A5|nr:hypothetical protein [Streptomyces sp. V1I1]MDQ0943723.1 hypothetical protein [Streptomyces sp. V1I1]
MVGPRTASTRSSAVSRSARSRAPFGLAPVVVQAQLQPQRAAARCVDALDGQPGAVELCVPGVLRGAGQITLEGHDEFGP